VTAARLIATMVEAGVAVLTLDNPPLERALDLALDVPEDDALAPPNFGDPGGTP
jgi:hypothetical protein